MYRPSDLARFALSEFARGLEGITAEEAQTRLTKADGTQMNSISWIVCHIANHWLRPSARLQRFAFGSGDPTPPPLDEALALLQEARAALRWLGSVDDGFLAAKPRGASGAENLGTYVMRAALHTWFHTGEINAIRQMLGHPEIPFVGQMLGNLEWHSRLSPITA